MDATIFPTSIYCYCTLATHIFSKLVSLVVFRCTETQSGETAAEGRLRDDYYFENVFFRILDFVRIVFESEIFKC